jgi:HlyD family secretion protein
MKRKKRTLLIIAGIALLAIIAVVFRSRAKKELEVEVKQASYRTIIESVSASGKIEPEVTVKISPEVSGEITELPVKEGDFVIQGQLLLRINPDVYISAVNRAEAALYSGEASLATARARLAQSEAQFKLAERTWKRSESLHAQGAISEAEFEQAQNSFEIAKAEVGASKEGVKSAEFGIRSAQATLKEAQDNLKRTTIYAPQAGTVTGLLVEKGERVVGTGLMGGTELMSISDLGSMEVNVEVNESDIVRVSIGDTASIEVDAYLNRKFNGIISEIGNVALNSQAGSVVSLDQVTNFSVKISILRESYADLIGNDTLGSPFRPGMSATVDIKTDRAKRALAIPLQSVTTRGDTTASAVKNEEGKEEALGSSAQVDEDEELIICAFVLNKNKAELRVLETGIQDSKYIQVISGIAEGEEVITGPYENVSRKLKNGSSVKVQLDTNREEKEID